MRFNDYKVCLCRSGQSTDELARQKHSHLTLSASSWSRGLRTIATRDMTQNRSRVLAETSKYYRRASQRRRRIVGPEVASEVSGKSPNLHPFRSPRSRRIPRDTLCRPAVARMLFHRRLYQTLGGQPRQSLPLRPDKSLFILALIFASLRTLCAGAITVFSLNRLGKDVTRQRTHSGTSVQWQHAR
jgi:hypothetical protein